MFLTALLAMCVQTVPVAQAASDPGVGEGPGAPPVPAATPPAAAAAHTIDLGEPRHLLLASAGGNFLVEDRAFGVIGLFRWNRRTNYTFTDLQLQGYVVPVESTAEDGSTSRALQTFALARFKRSEKAYTFPRFYDYSTYQVKTSSTEDLRMRANLETGYGAFVLDRDNGPGARPLSLNVELGAVFDYADIKAYADNVSTGYGKLGVEGDFDWGPISGKVTGQLFQQLVNANEANVGNQTHVDAEGVLHVKAARHVRATVGVLHTWFMRIDKSRFDQPAWTLTVFTGATVSY